MPNEETIKVKDLSIKRRLNGEYEIILGVDASEIQNPLVAYNIENAKLPMLATFSPAKKAKHPNSNAYFWALCDDIAKQTDLTKTDVYKEIIREVGKFEVYAIPISEFSKEKDAWEKRGRGWVVEISGMQGDYVEAFFFYGSSVYTQEELSRLISYAERELESLKTA